MYSFMLFNSSVCCFESLTNLIKYAGFSKYHNFCCMYRAGWSTKLKLWTSSVSMFRSPNPFLRLILIGCCYKRMWKEGPEQPIRALLTNAIATLLQFSKHGRKLQRKAQCFAVNSFYQCLLLLMMGQPQQWTHSTSVYYCWWWVNHSSNKHW